jgi:hypothetical protein
MTLDATFTHPEDGGTHCTETSEQTFNIKCEDLKNDVI